MKPCIHCLFWTLLFSLLTTLSTPNTARACGGFFCQTTPMNQAAERILFVVDQGIVTTHVQIEYSGDAADFAWILPVPSVPDLQISHNEIFNQLQLATQPTFVLNWQLSEETERCDMYIEDLMGGCSVCATAGGPSVDVVAEREVGPYHTAIITSEDAGAITTWLEGNGYALDALGKDLLQPYVDEGYYFLVLKLAPDRDQGDLQPIALTYAADEPGIPIRLTAVATQPDMGVLVWILGAHRAIPRNYLHVHINQARIDWLLGGRNYAQVVTEAANEAGGQAFATDYAGSSDIMDQRFYREGRFDIDALRRIQDPADFLDEAFIQQGFPRDQQMRVLLRRHIPIPESVFQEGFLEVVFDGNEERYEAAIEAGWRENWGEVSFYNNLRAYQRYTAEMDYDLMALADDLETIVVEPLRTAQHLFGDHAYLTRLYTTLSAEEMSVDPMFSFNPDLPDVSNIHTADARTVCSDSGQLEETSAIITLADGRILRPAPFSSVDPTPQTRLPAAALIEQLNISGPPVVIKRETAVEQENAIALLPAAYALLPNYPNPFNSGTILPFEVSTPASTITLRIYDLLGQPVRTLLQGILQPGSHEVVWDGLDHRGSQVASGIYLYRLEAGSTHLTRKLLLLR